MMHCSFDHNDMHALHTYNRYILARKCRYTRIQLDTDTYVHCTVLIILGQHHIMIHVDVAINYAVAVPQTDRYC